MRTILELTGPVEGPEYGGFTAVAEALQRVHGCGRVFTRQQVYTWWRRRDHNGFPERRYWVPQWDGRPYPVFRVSEVLAWYDAYRKKQ